MTLFTENLCEGRELNEDPVWIETYQIEKTADVAIANRSENMRVNPLTKHLAEGPDVVEIALAEALNRTKDPDAVAAPVAELRARRMARANVVEIGSAKKGGR